MLKKKMAAGAVALAMFGTLGLAACNDGSASGGGGSASGSIPTPDVSCDIPSGNVDESKIDTSKVDGEITFQTQGLQNEIAPAEGENPMPYIMPRNEQGAVHAAAAFAKTTNRLQTWMTTASIGPGSLNMVTGAATATTKIAFAFVCQFLEYQGGVIHLIATIILDAVAAERRGST